MTNAQLAQDVLSIHRIAFDGRGLRKYSDGCWRRLLPPSIRTLCARLAPEGECSHTRWSETARIVTAAAQQQRITIDNIKPYEAAAANGVVDLRTMTWRAPRPEDGIRAHVPWSHDPGAECPAFLRYVDEMFGGDEKDIAVLQAFFGSLLTSRAQKPLVICRACDIDSLPLVALRVFAGLDNCAGEPVENLRKGAAHIEDRLVNIGWARRRGAFARDLSVLRPLSRGVRHAFALTDEPFPGSSTDDAIVLYAKSYATDHKFRRRGEFVDEAPGILSWALEGAKRSYEREAAGHRLRSEVAA